MNFIRLDKDDICNGTGIRCVLWFSGCSHHCKNCHNPETWDENFGEKKSISKVEELIKKELSKTYIKGITLTGGDPLYPGNEKDATEICKYIKTNFPDKDIWVYTGYSFENLIGKEILNYIDILVDGEFINELKNPKLKWKGSKNQRVINIPETLKQNKIILSKEN